MQLPENSPIGGVMLPHGLADWPRVFLDMLSSHSRIPDQYRNAIAAWLDVYNTTLASYIISNYGLEAAYQANALSIVMEEHLREEIRAAQQEFADDLFSKLEDDMNDDGDR